MHRKINKKKQKCIRKQQVMQICDVLVLFQEDHEAYQAAAKEALDNLYAEKLKAEASIIELERETQEATYAHDVTMKDFLEAQSELEVIPFSYLTHFNLKKYIYKTMD